MSLKDTANYIFFTNPVSNSAISGISALGKSLGIKAKPSDITPKNLPTSKISMPTYFPKLCGPGLFFFRLSGLSGASAVILGAYGAHKPFPKSDDIDLKKVFETANRFHFFHSLALIGVPLSRRPIITGILMVTGMTLFCFPCYYRAFTSKTKYNRVAPIGGICLIVAWLSMVL